MSKLSGFVIALGLAAIAAGIYLWWQHEHPIVPVSPPADVATIDNGPAGPFEPPTPEVKYPVDAIEPAPGTPAADAGTDIGQAVTALVGRDAVLKFFQLGDFPRRIVATIDNLARSHAAPTLWPVNPTPGRFTVEGTGENQIIAAANSIRYQPFVAMARGLDTDKLVALYVNLYPQLQKAYEDIGYPRGYFNDRVVAVIDNLLATPDPAGPLAVTLTEVKGTVKPERPWVRYEYADPALESTSAGQRILLRMGADNRKQLKARLTAIRARIVGGAALSKAPAP